MKVIIIGANGKVGRLITQQMKASAHFEPTAFIRKQEQKSYFENLGVATVVDSLENSEEHLKEVLKGYDVVVFTAGSGASTGYDKTIEIDLYTAIKIINAAKKNHVKRFVMIGAAFSDQPSYWSKQNMKPYYIAKHLADKELVKSGLDFTILRPVKLTDDENAGTIQITSNPNELNDVIPRKAVAQVVISSLKNPNTVNKIMEISEGEFSIEEAINTF